MKYITEFRDQTVAKALAAKIHASVDPNRCYQIMEFCGGHTHAIHRYGIPSLLPKNIELIHGPGCPVCVLPIARVDYAIALSKLPNVILCSYGDMLRVPGSDQQSLLKAKAQAADVRMVYSIVDALNIARKNPNKDVIFFAIGFETTTPPTADALLCGKREGLKNFSVFCNHVLTPVAMQALLQAEKKDITPTPKLDGFIGPAHVSIIIGSDAYQTIALEYQKPIVISGFEPLDVMHSILLLVEMINQQQHGIQNQFTRAVTAEGNCKSQQIMAEVLELRSDFEWRGLGWIANSALKIKADYQAFDAEHRYPLMQTGSKEHAACECPAILRGAKRPTDCKLFATVCTPDNPLGACMVSSEGACSAYYAYGRLPETKSVIA